MTDAIQTDRQPDNINVLGYRGGHNLLGVGECLVDDLEARIPRPDGDLLGAIGMAVEARLTDEEPERSTACGGEFRTRAETRAIDVRSEEELESTASRIPPTPPSHRYPSAPDTHRRTAEVLKPTLQW